jgi:hypothetical protein
MNREPRSVRRHLTLGNEGFTVKQTVFCSAERGSVDVRECRTCARAHHVSPRDVLCVPPGRRAAGLNAPAGMAAVASATFLRADLRGAWLDEVMREARRPVPVVDRSDGFVGFVPGGGAPLPLSRCLDGPPTARDVAKGGFLRIVETAPLGFALRMMARAGARSLALVSETGAARGILWDVDALHAIAQAQP